MNIRPLALAVVTALTLNATAFTAVDKRPKVVKKKSVAARLVASLPASDGVAVLDARRLNDTLPRLLASNQKLLGKITGHITEIQDRTTIDIRQFDQVAVGIKFRQVSAKETDYEPVVIASGPNVADLPATAALRRNTGGYREETIAGKKVHIFFGPEDASGRSSNPAVSGMVKEIAVTALDRNTLAIGTLERVRATIEGREKPSVEITNLLMQREGSMASFASKMHAGMSRFLPLDSDELGKSLESVKVIAGAVEMTATGATLNVLARTQKPEDAAQLFDTLDVLRVMGKGVLGASKRPDQQLYARLLGAAKLNRRGTDITLDAALPQTDLDALLAILNK